MAAATPEIAVVAKLKATAAIATATGSRVFAQLDTQEAALPAIIVTKIGSEGGKRLSGAAHSLRANAMRVDCYAETELAAGALGKLVRDALCPDGTPWTDSANGVQGCFFVDSVGEVTEDGLRFQSETFQLWHSPT